METNEKIRNIKEELKKELVSVEKQQELIEIKAKYLGKKGVVTELTANMKELSIEEKKELGQLVN